MFYETGHAIALHKLGLLKQAQGLVAPAAPAPRGPGVDVKTPGSKAAPTPLSNPMPSSTGTAGTVGAPVGAMGALQTGTTPGASIPAPPPMSANLGITTANTTK